MEASLDRPRRLGTCWSWGNQPGRAFSSPRPPGSQPKNAPSRPALFTLIGRSSEDTRWNGAEAEAVGGQGGVQLILSGVVSRAPTPLHNKAS